MVRHGINVNEVIGKLAQTYLGVDMGIDEFETAKQKFIGGQNQKLREIEANKIEDYKKLLDYRRAKNSLELGGSFRKDLADSKSPEEKAEWRKKYKTKIDKIVSEVQAEYGTNVSRENVEEILSREAEDVANLVVETRSGISDIARECDLTLNSCIFVAPQSLNDGKLETSKSVMDTAGNVGDFVFAQSGRLVDNPYLLRKSGKGVCSFGNYCIPGDAGLIKVEDGKAVLADPAYVYFMKPDKFEPVVTVDYLQNGEPAIRFDGEWTSESDIDKDEFEVKKYTDITEMLEYLQLFAVSDVDTYMQIANLSEDERTDALRDFVVNGKLQYINGECGVNVKPEISLGGKLSLSRETVRSFASKPEVQLEKENAAFLIDEFTKDKGREENFNVRSQ